MAEPHATTRMAGADGGSAGTAAARGALGQIVESARVTLGADRVTCYAVDVGSQAVAALQTTEADPSVRRALGRVLGRDVASLPLWPRNIDGTDLVAIERVAHDRRVPARYVDAVGAGAFVGVVLEHPSVGLARERALGALFCSYRAPRRFSPADLDGVRGVADLASLALANTHLRRLAAQRLAENRALVAEHSALRRVATQVAGGASLSSVSAQVALEVVALLDSEAALVVRFTPRAATVVGAHGPGAAPGRLIPLRDRGTLAEVAATGRAGIAEAPMPPEAFAVADPGVTIVAPVVVDGITWGAVVAAIPRSGRVGPADVDRLGRFADLVALAAANARIKERLVAEASTDELTGLLNHRAFNRRLEAASEIARRHGRPLSLVIMDLDHFKRVNDRHGHKAGDEVLVGTARRLGRCVRRGDTLARIGGEEFGWILPETPMEAALATAERARKLVGTVPFPESGALTVSAGVAAFRSGMSVDDLFRAADDALYRAKAAGRDRAVSAAQGRSR